VKMYSISSAPHCVYRSVGTTAQLSVTGPDLQQQSAYLNADTWQEAKAVIWKLICICCNPRHMLVNWQQLACKASKQASP
jgi:hypothetical protein